MLSGFAPGESPTVGAQPESVAAGDFNGDGTSDLAVANYFGDSVSVLLANTDATLRTQVIYATGYGPTSVAIGDFNDDGKSDLAVASLKSNAVDVLLGNGDGTFQPSAAFDTDYFPSSVTVGDFNGDGESDLGVTNFGSQTVSVLLGYGDGTFQTQVSYPTGSTMYGLAAGDFNGDGNSDLAVAINLRSSVSVMLSREDGTFPTQVEYATGSTPVAVAIGDFNGDGFGDLAVANAANMNVSVLLGRGDGTFQTEVKYSTGFGPFSVVVEDFDGDGHSDLATANLAGNTVSVLLGLGDGTFETEVEYSTGLNPRSVTVGDFNRDGLSDLATANSLDNTVSVLLNEMGGTLISTSNADRAEGDSESTPFTFAVTRDDDASGSASVDYAVTGSGDHPADANDFGGSFPSGTVTFEPGEMTKIITINVSGDTSLESDEGFAVTLSNSSTGSPIVRAVAFGTIRNDDHDLVYSSNGNMQITATVLENGHLQVKLGTVIQPDVDPALVGSLTINGGSRNDMIDLTSLSRRVYSALTSIVLNGNAGNDKITGSADFSETISGGAGDDVLNGGTGGNDRLVESAANGKGATLSLTLTNTALTGGLGRDTLSNFEEAVLTGGERSDRLDASGFTGQVTLSGADGSDTLTGGRGNDSIIGGNGSDSLSGGGGNDTVSGELGSDTLDGGTGTDRLQETGDVNFKLTNTTLSGLGSDTLKMIETVRLTGGAGNNRLDASGFTLGSVTLDGGEGHDVLFGGSKNDSLIGGGGRDLLIGGTGIDVLNGNAGDDILIGGTITSAISTPAALTAIMAEWSSAGDLATRQSHLLNGGGLNGTNKLNNTTVKNDTSAKDSLTGGGDETDWFFQSAGDVLVDFSVELGDIKSAI